MRGIVRNGGILVTMILVVVCVAVGQRHAPPPVTPDQTGMTNVGEVLMPPEVGGLYDSAIDPFNGRAYFGTRHSQAIVTINVHESVPKVLQDVVPSQMPPDIGALIMRLVDFSDGDSRKHYIYATERGNQILKIAPFGANQSPQVLAVLRPTAASGQVKGSVIDTSDPDPARHYAYFVGGTGIGQPPKLIRVRLSDFSEQGAETLPVNCIGPSAIDTVRHYAYFLGRKGGSKLQQGFQQICKVNLATFHDGGTVAATLTMDSTKPGDGITRVGFENPTVDIGFVIDEVHGYAYLGTSNGEHGPNNDKWPNNQSMVIQVKLGDGDSFPDHPLKTIDLRVGERGLSAAVIDMAHGDVYFGTDNTYPAHIYMIHVGDGTQPMREVGRLDLNMGSLKPDQLPPDGINTPGDKAEEYGETFIRSAILDTQRNAIYFGTDTKPAQVIKVGTSAYASEPKNAQEFSKRVEALLAPLEHTDRPGIAVEVIDHGQVILNKGYGLANLETKAPVTPNTQFLLASCSKQFTAMAIMLLQQRGQLHYDDALTQYFPQFPDYARKITIRNLLNHTGGLPEYGDVIVKEGKVEEAKGHWPRAASTPPSPYEPTAHDALESLERVSAPLFPAGEKFAYSNSGYVVLAQIVEKVSGMRFAEFVKQNIFGPLGMKDSYVYDERKQKGRNVAASYSFVPGDDPAASPENYHYVNIDYTPLNFIYGEDNVITTLNDMAKWDQGLEKNKLLPASALAEAYTPGHTNDGKKIGYGFGWFLSESNGVNYQYHTGSWLGFRTYIGRSQEKDFTVIVLSNCGRPHVFMPTRYQKLPEQQPGLQGMFENFVTKEPAQ